MANAYSITVTKLRASDGASLGTFPVGASPRGVAFDGKPHLIAKMDDHDLWMAFFKDPEGHTLALMQEAPKGYSPAS